MAERRSDRGATWAAYTRASSAFATAQQELARIRSSSASLPEVMRARQLAEQTQYELHRAYQAWQQLPAETQQSRQSLTLHPGSG
jgi:hypothetical protein